MLTKANSIKPKNEAVTATIVLVLILEYISAAVSTLV